ncbi:MAG: bifunctional diguanylate cyclase/phosphodiesterase [Geminicoccaceae bacterium]
MMRRSLTAAIPVAGALLIFGASMALTKTHLERVTDAVLETTTEASWTVFQARFELERLLHAIDRALADGSAVTARDARVRLDIFLSRLEALAEGEDSAGIRGLPGALPLIGGLQTELGYETGADGVPLARTQLEVLRARATAAQEPLQALVLQQLHLAAAQHSALRGRIDDLSTAGWIALFGLIGSTGILVLLLLREITRTRQLLRRAEDSHRRIERLAHDDPLTGLANRRAFDERLAQAIAAAERQGRRFALLFIDLDRLKEINDTFGHRTGDELLRSVAQQLRAVVRTGDVVGRLGGDEFAVLQHDVAAPGDAAGLAERLHHAVAQRAYVAGGATAAVSIGIALYPDDGGTADALRSNADLALYHAKSRGRGRWAFYREELTVDARLRVVMRRELSDAIATGGLELYYQPQVDARTYRLTGVEALLRWPHPTRGLLMPGAFIPAAEEVGLIEPLGTWALARACDQLVAWIDAGLVPPMMSVNLSPAQLRHRTVARTLRELMGRTGLTGELIQLELTEHVLLDDDPRVLDELAELRALGVSLALDDFGNGYSSLSYLNRLAPRTLKIDRSFVARFGSPEAETICHHVVQLAHDLGIVVVAEGIETEAQCRIARDLGADQLQGFLFAPPVRVADITELLRRDTDIHPSPAAASLLVA